MLEWLAGLGSTLKRWIGSTNDPEEVDPALAADSGTEGTRTPHPEHGKRGRHPVHPHTHPVPGRSRTRPPRSC